MRKTEVGSGIFMANILITPPVRFLSQTDVVLDFEVSVKLENILDVLGQVFPPHNCVDLY